MDQDQGYQGSMAWRRQWEWHPNAQRAPWRRRRPPKRRWFRYRRRRRFSRRFSGGVVWKDREYDGFYLVGIICGIDMGFMWDLHMGLIWDWYGIIHDESSTVGVHQYQMGLKMDSNPKQFGHAKSWTDQWSLHWQSHTPLEKDQWRCLRACVQRRQLPWTSNGTSASAEKNNVMQTVVMGDCDIWEICRTPMSLMKSPCIQWIEPWITNIHWSLNISVVFKTHSTHQTRYIH